MRVRLGARGKTRVGAHPPFRTTITQPAANQSAIRWARVVLPRALSTHVDALNEACSQADFDAGRCSDVARVGRVRAVSPLVSRSLSGPVWIVKRERGLPKLVAQLRGPLALDLEGVIRVGRRGKIATTFPIVPDVTVTRFTIALRGGSNGILEAVQNLCTRRLFLPSRFHAWNGERERQRPAIRVRGCQVR